MAFLRDQYWDSHLDLPMVKRLALNKASYSALLMVKCLTQHFLVILKFHFQFLIFIHESGPDILQDVKGVSDSVHDLQFQVPCTVIQFCSNLHLSTIASLSVRVGIQPPM